MSLIFKQLLQTLNNANIARIEHSQLEKTAFHFESGLQKSNNVESDDVAHLSYGTLPTSLTAAIPLQQHFH